MSVQVGSGLQNQLLVNPKLGQAEREVFEKMQLHFENIYGQDGYLFVPSSGSSKKENESSKLIVLTRVGVANAAERFNTYFQATSQDSWGLVLPTFHVAGLSILARANLAKARVFSSDWITKKIPPWLGQNKIAFLSLVPTQVYDLVQMKAKAHSGIKKVFVGGGTLNENLRSEFINLGWPLVETYGMTETCAMVAVKEGKTPFKVMPGVDVYVEDGLLRIKCNSTAHFSIQMIQGKIEVTHFDTGWVRTEDQVKLEKFNDKLFLHFLGRASDYIKILGEGVSLPELWSNLEKVATEFLVPPGHQALLAIEDPRLGNKLVLAVDSTIGEEKAQGLMQKFNQVVRAYEKIHKIVKVDSIPLTDLGKIKGNELKSIVLKKIETEAE